MGLRRLCRGRDIGWMLEKVKLLQHPNGIRQRPTLPGRLQPSTISAWRLNFCVRYGNRWDPPAIATGKRMSFSGDAFEDWAGLGLLPSPFGGLCPWRRPFRLSAFRLSRAPSGTPPRLPHASLSVDNPASVLRSPLRRPPACCPSAASRGCALASVVCIPDASIERIPHAFCTHPENRTGKVTWSTFVGPKAVWRGVLHRRLRLCLPTASAHMREENISDQALDRLVPASSTHCCAFTADLSTLWSSRGLTCFMQWESSSSGGLHA